MRHLATPISWSKQLAQCKNSTKWTFFEGQLEPGTQRSKCHRNHSVHCCPKQSNQHIQRHIRSSQEPLVNAHDEACECTHKLIA